MRSWASRSRAISAAFSTAQYEAGVPFVPTTICGRSERADVSVCRGLRIGDLPAEPASRSAGISHTFGTYRRYAPDQRSVNGVAGLFSGQQQETPVGDIPAG